MKVLDWIRKPKGGPEEPVIAVSEHEQAREQEIRSLQLSHDTTLKRALALLKPEDRRVVAAVRGAAGAIRRT